MNRPNMIDTSGNNHPDGEAIDWPAVKAVGVNNAMIKASQSVTYSDAWRERDGKAAVEAGVRVGYYHYAVPGATGMSGDRASWRRDAIDQANYFTAAIATLPRSIGVALDLEVAGRLVLADGAPDWPALSEWATDFLGALRTVEYLWLYSNDYWLTNLPGAPWGYELWYSNPSGNLPPPRFHVNAWQYGASDVPGVPTTCDVNHFYGMT